MIAGTTLPDASSDKISSEEAETVQTIAHDQIALLDDYEYSESVYEDEDEDEDGEVEEVEGEESDTPDEDNKN